MIRVVKKAAIFDFDGTLVKPKEGRTFPKNAHDWQWLRASVPETVRKWAETHEIILRTDQSKAWKLDMIREAMADIGVPYTAIISTQKETNKPDTHLFQQTITDIGLAESFYVGDAAGRKGDWSNVDAEFAKAIGLRFFVPEDIFPASRAVYTSAPAPVTHQREVIVMVGYPASGKTTIATAMAATGNYVRIDGDALKTSAKMRKEAKQHIATTSVIFDATNGTRKKRAEFIEFAKSHGVPVRAVWVATPIEQAMERNKERAHQGGIDIPNVVYYVYRKNFEEPTTEEGFQAVESLNT